MGAGAGGARGGVWRRAAVLAGLSGWLVWLTFAAPARAEETASGSSVDGVLRALQLKGRTAPAAPFVVQSRPKAPQGFLPVHAAPPPGPVRIKTPAEVAATEADLDAARIRQQRAAGQTPPPVPLKAAKAGKRASPTLR